MLVTDELAPRCSCSACSEELKDTEFPSQLLQITDFNLVHDNVPSPGKSNTKNTYRKDNVLLPTLPAGPEHSKNPSVI